MGPGLATPLAVGCAELTAVAVLRGGASSALACPPFHSVYVIWEGWNTAKLLRLTGPCVNFLVFILLAKHRLKRLDIVQ